MEMIHLSQLVMQTIVGTQQIILGQLLTKLPLQVQQILSGGMLPSVTIHSWQLVFMLPAIIRSTNNGSQIGVLQLFQPEKISMKLL